MKENFGGLWNEVFTMPHIMDYGRAALEMADFLRVLFAEGYDSIVIPSRGSVPLFQTAQSAWYLQASNAPTIEARFAGRVEIANSPMHSALILPFSADTADSTQTSTSIRKYWAKVLAAIVRRDGKNPELLFYKAVVQHAARKKWVDVLPRNLPSEKFVFIDTVVSGRAISEIIDAFSEIGLNECHLLLIVDDNGKGIEGRYLSKIEALQAIGRCTLINVKKLWTEDRGPAVSGVWSTVYPQILKGLQDRYEWSTDAYGAGSFYHRVSSSQVEPQQGLGDPEYNMPVTVMYASVSTLCFTAMQGLQSIAEMPTNLRAINPNLTDNALHIRQLEFKGRLENQIQFQLNQFKDQLAESKPLTPLAQETTKALAWPRVAQTNPKASIKISGSHLIRVKLPEADVNKVFSSFERDLRDKSLDAFADDWFRK